MDARSGTAEPERLAGLGLLVRALALGQPVGMVASRLAAAAHPHVLHAQGPELEIMVGRRSPSAHHRMALPHGLLGDSVLLGRQHRVVGAAYNDVQTARIFRVFAGASAGHLGLGEGERDLGVLAHVLDAARVRRVVEVHRAVDVRKCLRVAERHAAALVLAPVHARRCGEHAPLEGIKQTARARVWRLHNRHVSSVVHFVLEL
mmetsp:Transcript_39051/g.91363  ORF Transcript_39051/g.91363 Transcript_39051/m.91363 type:complete len:204 (+) Transcript_39051:265-876(+)